MLSSYFGRSRHDLAAWRGLSRGDGQTTFVVRNFQTHRKVTLDCSQRSQKLKKEKEMSQQPNKQTKTDKKQNV
jgi:hypothetical protein